ncbi:hypothetical protein PL9214650069 [Planktothrix tepida PCC 9214]|uniref:Uncharacterized protein n=1 Tax=Planktothrix tepida PCC 9214 TaxID=671072 RepID=A0A1J1LQY2_9CYAN|nr:hypothetical protein PL9214650069 [Planktothrix tepida PCC 9214]
MRFFLTLGRNLLIFIFFEDLIPFTGINPLYRIQDLSVNDLNPRFLIQLGLSQLNPRIGCLKIRF